MAAPEKTFSQHPKPPKTKYILHATLNLVRDYHLAMLINYL